MKRRLQILLFCFVTLPIALVVWMGIRIAEQEELNIKRQQEEVFRSRLVLLKKDISQFIEDYQSELLAELERLATERGSPRDLRSSSLLFTDFFILENSGKLQFPGGEYAPLSNLEMQFVERTAHVWSEKLVGRALRDAQRQVGSSSQVPFLSKSQNRKSAQFFSAEPRAWLPYFHAGEQRLLLFYKSASGLVFGGEVDMYRLKSLFLLTLSETSLGKIGPSHSITLGDPDREPFYIWGQSPLVGDGEVASELVSKVFEELPLPLRMWRLSYFSPPAKGIGGVSKIVLFNIVGGVAAFITLFFGLGIMIYRSQTRAIREAVQRVSFVNQVSHELKTPLTSIRMYAEMLEDALDAEECESELKKVRIISRESQRLSRLIANILSFGQREAGKLTVKYSEVDLSDFLRDLLDQFQPSLAALDIDLAIENRAPEETVMIDRDACYQVLANLLSNAEKYASSATKVIICAEKRSDLIVFHVIDDGPGVAKRDRQKIFEAFYRSSDALTQTKGGSGIGLHIARELARSHGGDLVYRATDSGAHFEFSVLEKKES